MEFHGEMMINSFRGMFEQPLALTGDRTCQCCYGKVHILKIKLLITLKYQEVNTQMPNKEKKKPIKPKPIPKPKK
ncbi:MAG: hypothetical protein D4R88_07805 [Methanosarcinales archaeon]|nr:MAG: hypothetical protein D4R88_07805 [Methanosarcinales archaeon]